MPFAYPWTDELELESFLAFHDQQLQRANPDAWTLNFVTFLDGAPIGSQTLAAWDFPVARTVATGSWLGTPFQGWEFGAEMRSAVLELAFLGLGATAAVSGYLDGNEQSRRISERLGYRVTGRDTISPRGEPVGRTSVRLERYDWRGNPTVIEGLDLVDFGAQPDAIPEPLASR